MKLGLSARELRTIATGGALGIVVFAVYVSALLKPLWREAASLGQQVRSSQEQLLVLRQSTTNEAAMREQHRHLQEAVLSLRKVLLSDAELPSVIEFLSGLASQTQVKIQTIFPQRPLEPFSGQAKTPPELMAYKEIPIQIDAQASYHQLGTFLGLIEASDKPMQVATLRISGNPKDPRWHTISLSLLAYFAVSDANASAQGAPGHVHTTH